jgi:hypothetical protein
MDIPHRFVRLDPKDQSLRVEKTEFIVTENAGGLTFEFAYPRLVGRQVAQFPGLIFFRPCAEGQAATNKAVEGLEEPAKAAEFTFVTETALFAAVQRLETLSAQGWTLVSGPFPDGSCYSAVLTRAKAQRP